MKKYDKEILQTQLKHEKAVIKELKEMYEEAEKQIEEKIQMLMTDELTQSKIYQLEYQKALKGQIDVILDNMNSNNYDSIQSYLKRSYEDGYIGTMYSLQQQGIPLIMPINQEQVVKAIQLDSKVSGTLYEAMGVNTNDLKKSIRNEVSRGISNAYSYQDIARNLNNKMKIGLNKSIRIARTEGHRITQESTMDGMTAAKNKGADVVKQWDATLDSRTRSSHRKVDGEIKELDEKFSNGLRFPGDPMYGTAGEVINCRCVLLQRARWALDEDELKVLKERASFFGLDDKLSYTDYKTNYFKAFESNTFVRSSNTNINSIKEVKKVLTNKVGFKAVDDSIDKIDEELAIANTKQLQYLENKFGVIHNSTCTIASINEGNVKAYVSASTLNPLKETLSLCNKYYNNKTSFIDLMRNDVLTGYSMPCALNDDELSIYNVTHEYGHMLQNQLVVEKMKLLGWSEQFPDEFINLAKKTDDGIFKWYNKVEQKVTNQCYNEIIEIAKNNNQNFELLDNLSRYGTKNEHEFFAEVFANSQLSKPNELGMAMNMWLEKKGLVSK